MKERLLDSLEAVLQAILNLILRFIQWIPKWRLSKTSLNGILSLVSTTGVVLLATGNSIFSQRVTATIALAASLARAYSGLLQQDADRTLARNKQDGTVAEVDAHPVPDDPANVAIASAK